tara:strand:+ start:174 stop:827 length:654 start_codon:yes stop_codon:yes gene_type:complete
MTLPSSGAISLGQISEETSTVATNPPSFGYSPNLNDPQIRTLAGSSSYSSGSTISFNQLYGANGNPDFNLSISASASRNTQFYSEYEGLGYGLALMGFSSVALFGATFGALGQASWKGTTIRYIYQFNAGWELTLSVNGSFANNGWSTMTINGASGLKTYNRSSATYSYSVGSNGGTGNTTWTWPATGTSPAYTQLVVPGQYNTAWFGYVQGTVSFA